MAADTVELPDGASLADFAPFAIRCLDLDPQSTIRLVGSGAVVRGYVRLPYDVIAGRSLAVGEQPSFDITVSATDFLNWQDSTDARPVRQDAAWLTPVPPVQGWRRVETVAEADIRGIVGAGALTARAEVDPRRQQALMDATVLTATDGAGTVEVRLATVSLLTKLGFLPREAEAHLDAQAGWLRVTGPLGSTYQQSAGQSPSVLRLL
jgi:hypothetical protein